MNNIKKIRIKRKITQVDLARVINVKQETISAYESGKAQPSCEALIKIADYFSGCQKVAGTQFCHSALEFRVFV